MIEEVDIKEAAKMLAADNLTTEQTQILSDLIDEVLESRLMLAKLTQRPVNVSGKGATSPEIPQYPCDPLYPVGPDCWDPNRAPVVWEVQD